MQKTLVPILFPVLGAHMCVTEFQYSDLIWKKLCGIMANLVADSGYKKGLFSNLLEAICRNFRLNDRSRMSYLCTVQESPCVKTPESLACTLQENARADSGERKTDEKPSN